MFRTSTRPNVLSPKLPNRFRLNLAYELDDRGFESRQGLGILLFTIESGPAVGPPQPPIQWVSGALSLGLKRPWREADHLPPSSAEVRNTCSYTSTPQYALKAWCLVRQRGNFTFNFMSLLSTSFKLNATRNKFLYTRLEAIRNPEQTFS